MTLTYDDMRRNFDSLAEQVEEWHGIPIPLPELPLRLHARHPMQKFYREWQDEVDGVEIEVMVGGPNEVTDDEVIRNEFFSRKANARIVILQQGDKVFHVKILRSPDQSMDRLKYWINTIGSSDAWDMDAEYKAREKLRGMVTERQWRHYDLTGSFFESSSRSRLLYVFRRLRPTVVLSPRQKPDALTESMRCIAVLCMHPIGYYGESWGGCLVPTDDVIAHLTFMRGDEAGYWGEANQHASWTPEAGL